MDNVTVKIINRDTGEVVEAIFCGSVQEALKVERGININLNHRDYQTDIDFVGGSND